MITYDILEKNIKSNKIDNSYIFCGQDEELIKEGVNQLVKPFVQEDMVDLNYIRIDGNTVSSEEVINACETMPFMGEKKVVVLFRANFLKDKVDSNSEKVYKEIK